MATPDPNTRPEPSEDRDPVLDADSASATGADSDHKPDVTPSEVPSETLSETPADTPFDRRRAFVPVAGILALLLPGFGHVYLGLRQRGARVAGGVFGLFALGLLVGGLDVVDAEEDPWWYAGQALVGPPAWAANYAHQAWFKFPARDTETRRKPEPGEVVTSSGFIEFGGPDAELPAMSPSIGRMNEVGSLACALAGMMNLIAILDAVFPPLRRRSEGARL
ncbi:MAG: DUF6677 family protein [Planctomycetota bacterium]